MPHRQPILLAIGRVLLPFALCATAACSGDRSRAAQVDTTTGKKSVVVLAHTAGVPDDPAIRAATAALDSLTKSFAQARASLDSESMALSDENRLDSIYARHYSRFEERRTAAAGLRAARDRARKTRDSLVARGGKH